MQEKFQCVICCAVLTALQKSGLKEWWKTSGRILAESPSILRILLLSALELIFREPDDERDLPMYLCMYV